MEEKNEEVKERRLYEKRFLSDGTVVIHSFPAEPTDDSKAAEKELWEILLGISGHRRKRK